LKWEFPGGKVEVGEFAPKALQREIFEELGISVEVGLFIGTFATPLDKYLIQLECYWCTSQDREVTLSIHEEAGWFEPVDLNVLDWALTDLPVLEVVLRTLANKPSSGIV
jgi:8-oxo-dGTP diphosphatase